LRDLYVHRHIFEDSDTAELSSGQVFIPENISKHMNLVT